MNFLRRITKHRSKVFISWVVSYVIILIIPIVIGIYVYERSINAINEEVSKAHTAALEQVKIVMDGRFEELSLMGNIISQNRYFHRIFRAEKEFDAADIVNIVEAQKELTKFQVSKSYIDNIYIYINNNDTLFTSVNKYASFEINDIILNTFGMNNAEFSNMARTRQLRNVRIFNNTVLFVQSLFLHDVSEPEGLYIVTFDRRWIEELLDTMEWLPEGSARMIDDRNISVQSRIISFFPTTADYEYMQRKIETFYANHEGRQFIVTSILSDITSVRYVSAIPSEIYHSSAKDVQTIVVVYVIVYLLIGSILTVIFVNRNYNPVDKLMTMLKDKTGQSYDKESNEFRYLENMLNKLLSRNISLVETINMQSDSARNDLLIKLFKGKVKNEKNITEKSDIVGVNFLSDKFMIAAYMIEKLDVENYGINAMADDKTVSLVNFMIKNITEEIIRNCGHAGYVAEMDGLALCLVSVGQEFAEDTDRSVDQIMTAFKRIIDILDSESGVIANLTVSGVSVGFEGIAKTYGEVAEMLEYRTFFEIPDKILTVDSVRLTDKEYIGYNSNLDKERQFLNCFNVKDYKRAKEILNEIISNEIESNSQSIKLARCKMSGLVNLMLNAIGEAELKADIDFLDKFDPLKLLRNNNSVAQMKSQINKMFDSLIEYTSASSRHQEPEWLSVLEKYIIDNYMKPDVSINCMAEYLELSVSYLSRAFKKHRVIGLLDYLHKVRLDKAKALLREDLSIKDVAERVGYIDSKGLIRAFRRYEGITPGKFRIIE